MVVAFVMVRIGPGEYLDWMRTVKERVAEVPEVTEVYSVFGRYDLIIKVEAESIDGVGSIVDDKIRPIAGVVSTETFIAHA
ncbi:MAG: Lrp/AsnC family transcriptional regulator [Candidatus Geothermarchaeales archaeon]